MTKWPIQQPTHRTAHKHTEHQDATNIRKETIVCVFGCFSFYDNLKNFIWNNMRIIQVSRSRN